MSKIVKTVNTKTSDKQTAKKISQQAKTEFSNFWKTKNIVFLVAGFAALLAGFYLMSVSPWDSDAALNYSPLFLLAAYLIFFPLSIFVKNKK